VSPGNEYKLILETASVAIMILEEDTTVSMVNPQFAQFSGYDREEIEGVTSWTEFVIPDDLKIMREYYRQRMKAPETAPNSCEVRFRTKTGEIRSVVLTVGKIPGTNRSVASVLDISGWKKTKEQLTYMATHDVLTGLPNRAVFTDRLAMAVAQAQRNQKKFAVMLLDLDRFKDINDRLGHTIGDELLQSVARRLSEAVRKSDTVARMGGDEFLFLFPEITRDESIETIARKILGTFREAFLIQGRAFHVTSSIGISVYPEDGHDADMLVRNADIAMYRVKQRGRNNYQRYTPAITPQRPQLKVLLLEPTASYASVINTMLNLMRGPQFDLEWMDRLGAGLERLDVGDIDIVLADLTLPDSTGLDTLSKLLEHASQTPIIILTASDDADLAVKAVHAGAQDYLIKGEIDDALLVRSIQYAIERHRIQRELRRQTSLTLESREARFRTLLENSADGVVLTDQHGRVLFVNRAAEAMLGQPAEQLLGIPFSHPMVVGETTEFDVTRETGDSVRLEMRVVESEWEEEAAYLAYLHDITQRRRAERELRECFNRWRSALDDIIEALAATIGSRDLYVATHQQRVTTLACAIAHEMDLPEARIEGLRLAATVHDIGKVYVPSEILNKPGSLSDVEHQLVETHPTIGYDILRNVESPWPVAEIVYQHHERLDGSGYPQALSDGQILQEAKILGVADVVEAIVSRRSYRPPGNVDDALEEITRNSGTLYDPDVVKACVTLFREKEFTF
jgi:diguanylate cyclase (GGDEF)-like protein/PAS domain S-box-containing protein/putative nucleotidyltransferase with HDIG domain